MNTETKQRTIAFITYMVATLLFTLFAIRGIREGQDFLSAGAIVAAAFSFFCAVRLTH